MRFGVLVAARMGSTRLPGKVLLPVMGMPLILFILKRLRASQYAADIVLATTNLRQDDELATVVEQAGFSVYRGAEHDVLGRYVEAARGRGFNYAVRVTGDCPLVSGDTLDGVIEECLHYGSFDVVTTKPAYPHGIDYEVYPTALLEQVHTLPDVTAEDREHMLNYVYRHEQQFCVVRLQPPASLPLHTEFLIDTPEDYQRLTALLDGETNVYITPYELAAKEQRYSL